MKLFIIRKSDGRGDFMFYNKLYPNGWSYLYCEVLTSYDLEQNPHLKTLGDVVLVG